MYNLSNNRGFSLLEVLVAVVVLSIGLLGMAGLTTGIMRCNAFSRRITTATMLAQHKMESLRGLGYSNTPMADTTTTEDYTTIAYHPSYKRITSIDAAEPAQGMKTMTVIVLWDNDAHSAMLTTILAR